MTKEEIIKYIEFRASGVNQAINYDYKEFYDEMLEMCKQEKQVKQNELLHCPLCNSENLHQYKLYHIHCKDCKENFDKSCD